MRVTFVHGVCPKVLVLLPTKYFPKDLSRVIGEGGPANHNYFAQGTADSC